MRTTLIIGASVCCALGLFCVLLVLENASGLKSTSAVGFMVWGTYALLAFVPLAVLMRTRPHTNRGVQFTIVGLIEVCVIGLFLMMMLPISRAVDTPFMREYARIHEICVKLRHYADEHSTFPGGATTNANIDELAVAGALSADDVAYIREHRIEYRGFDMSNIAADTLVFSAVVTNTEPPRVITAYSDGHTVWETPHKTP